MGVGSEESTANLRVAVRLRPLTAKEQTRKEAKVVSTSGNRVVVSNSSSVLGPRSVGLEKMFQFDAAFGPYASQREIFETMVHPVVEEVLAGYNCTVFAYGQTGTGK